MKKLTVLGAGIAGISAAYHAQELGQECIVFEGEERYGGLLDNFTIEGFRFDKAVHLSFTKDIYVRSLFDQVPCVTHQPDPYNYEAGKWLKHPVQNNLFSLPISERIEAIKGFVERPNICSTNDYKEWLVQQFGTYIATRFPMKYTKKYWTVDAEHLNTEWIGNRLYRPSLDEVLFGAMTSQTPNTYYAREMRYPSSGGYKSFIEPLASYCKINTGKKAVCIDPENKYIEFETGQKTFYESLISTIPLTELITIIKNVPESICKLADTLWATSVALVSVGFKRGDIPPNLWFYIYDEDIFPARAYSPSLKSSDNVPPKCSSLQFEIYYSKYKPLPMMKDNLIEHVIRILENMNLAASDDIVMVDCRILPYANVVFERGINEKRKVIVDYLKTIGILVAGRFGEWDYLWSDQSLLSGRAAAEAALK